MRYKHFHGTVFLESFKAVCITIIFFVSKKSVASLIDVDNCIALKARMTGD